MQNSRWHDPLGSTASGCYSEPDIEMQYGGGRYSDHEDDEDEAFISFTTTESKCEQLFERGLELRLQGELEQALHCFLECMKGMQECQYFAKLPQTLRQLGELYNQTECYEKAVEFAQAEKLFYEAVIVDTSEQRPRTKRKPFSKKSSHRLTNRRGSNPAEYGDLLIKKADEFDKLSRICSQEKKFDLALDYCGKAAKIRQSVFGADHPATVSTLEYFTVLYAEVGRAEYIHACHSMRADETTDNVSIAKGDLCNVETLSATDKTKHVTHVPIHDTNEELQSDCEGKHSLQPSVNDISLIQEEIASTLKGTCEPHIPQPSLDIDHVQIKKEKGPWNKNTEDLKQETTSHTHLDGDSYLQTITIEGQEQDNLPKCSLLQPSSTVSNSNDIQDTDNNIQSKHTFNSPLSSLHSIHKELNAIKELQGCGVVWQPENRGIEQARCLPVWVLLLGAFIEMALLAYFLCFQ